MVKKIRIGGCRTNIGVRALFGCIVLISGLLTVVDEKFNVFVLASSEFYSSQDGGQSSASHSGSSFILGDEETENSTSSKVMSGLSADTSAVYTDSSNGDVPLESLPDGASLFQGDSSVAFDSPPDGLPSGPKITSPGVIEYGYNNIQESSVDAKSPYSERDKLEMSDPVIMESLENKPTSKIDSSRASFETFDGSILEQELNNNFKKMKVQEKLLEPLTENVEIVSSPMITPKTDSISKFSASESHADSHIESPPKTPDDFVMNDYEIKVEANPINQKEISQDPTGSEVVFEETSESKLPEFMTKEGESRLSQPGEESSQLTSGISEVSKSDASSLVNIESSNFFPKEEKKERIASQKEASFSTDISNNSDLSTKSGVEDRTHSFGFVDESRSSRRTNTLGELSTAESSFVNPNTEDISMVPSDSEATIMDVSNRIKQSFVREPSKTASVSIEPPSPPSSAIEEKTVGNNRIYSGPYIRTSATAGKVSPRIASVINSLVGQFEKFNLYGAGNRSEEGKLREQNMSNKFVSSMKSNFDRAASDSSDFVPQNDQEKGLVESLKRELPRNNFLFKNRFEEMKATRSSSGKTLLQEEIEKIRGTYRNALSKQFSTGKVWERPSNIHSANRPIQVTYSGDEFLDKVKLINPNYNIHSESHKSEATKEVDANLIQESHPERSEHEENTQYAEISHSSKQENPVYLDSPSPVESIAEKTQETEETTDEGYSDAESFSKGPVMRLEDSDQSSMDETQLNLNFQKAGDGSTNDESPRSTQVNDRLRTNSFGNMPFSYINTVKELPVGLKPQDTITEIPEAIMDRRSQIDKLEDQEHQLENQNVVNKVDDIQNREVSVSYSKDMELSPEQEKEINICYNRAKKIKTVNFGLQLTEHPNSAVTETFISEFTKYKPKIKELVNFSQEALRVAEKYNKKRSWRKKTKKFKLEFLELSNELLQHSKAIRSLLHHLIQVTNPNIMDILQQIITGHNHSKHSLLVQCKILYQAFYSYKNSVRNKLLKKISDLYFVDVLNNQIKIFLGQRFHPIVKTIQSNKYLKKKLSKHIPDVNIFTNINQYEDLSQTGGGELTTPNVKKSNKITRFFKRLFKKPSCIKCSRPKKQSKKQKLNNK